jgi:UDP-2,3-diacylglucosamine pyrophosphatase LpxH
MKSQEFIDKNKGNDKKRQIRLNKVILKPKNKKDYSEILFFGDVHYGHPQCLDDEAKRMLKYAYEKGIYVLIMGDLIEAGLRDSVGDSVYQQKLNPQKQMEEMIEWLRPLAKKGLIIGIHEGNHEYRITKATGIDITKIMARILDIPYLGYSCWHLLKIGDQNYTMYTTHGTSSSKFKHTKMKAVMDLIQWIDADIIAMGHVHSIASEPVIKQSVSLKNKIVDERKCYVVLTGSYLSWDRSYAQMKNMPITKIGSPKAKLFINKKDVHFSL